MLDCDLLEISANLLKDVSWEVREQAALLIAAMAISNRARDRFECAFANLKQLLEDKQLRVREAVAYVFRRLSVNHQGCSLIVQSQSADSMVQSFIGHSKDEKCLSEEDGQYLIHLLEAFVNLTFSDEGIQPLLGKQAVSTFHSIISKSYVSDILLLDQLQKI